MTFNDHLRARFPHWTPTPEWPYPFPPIAGGQSNPPQGCPEGQVFDAELNRCVPDFAFGDGGDDSGEGGGDGVEIIDDPPPPDPSGGGGEGGKRKKYVVGDVPVWVTAERVQYYGPDGRLITESLKDFTRSTVLQDYASLGDFLTGWNAAERKSAIVEELEERGVLWEALREEVGRDYDVFDLVCHVAFGQPPLTRRERAENVRKRNYFARYGEDARRVLDALLDKYANQGVTAIEKMGVLRVPPLDELGTPMETVGMFGDKEQYQQALRELMQQLYDTAA